jgi:hypothetical protein
MEHTGNQRQGSVSVTNATVSDHGIQFIGNTTIGSLHYGAANNEKPQRQYQTILQWLSPSMKAMKLQQIIHEESRTNHKIENTGQWFVRSDQFQNWLKGSTQLAWAHGPSK